MARRSSARLRNRNSSTPKRVSLSHDAATRTPRTAPVKLATLREDGDMPGAFPSSVSPSPRHSINNIDKSVSIAPMKIIESTPKVRTPIKANEEEMHPQKYQQSTAKPLEEARWLGFSNMCPHTEPAGQARPISLLQATPTKTSKSKDDVESAKFRFTFGRQQSLELSPEAKKLMEEKRKEAAKIRELMVTNGEGSEDVAKAIQRKIATPKGKKGRFSDAHMEQFKKMDSIATHPASFRAGLPAPKANQSSQKSDEEAHQHNAPSLKRSACKAQDAQESPSPTKRAKRDKNDDVSKCSMPHSNTAIINQANHSDMSTLATPTQASLARASNISPPKSSRIPASMLSRSPSKSSLPEKDESKPSTPLLNRSPAKASLFFHRINSVSENAKTATSPLLKRSPMKLSSRNVVVEVEKAEGEKPVRLLSCSPLKMSIAKEAESEEVEEKPFSSIPLLSRSPAKIALANANVNSHPNQTPVNHTSGNIMGRFNLPRSPPMKSILRSPQRLYSNDPAKVAAGTHLASPASGIHNMHKPSRTTEEASPSVQKHVDFTSSTKERYERGQSESSSTPSKGPTPTAKSEVESEATAKPLFAEYPSLPSTVNDAALTPQKRRQTAAPYDFTFTAHGSGIVFGQSPNAPISAANSKSPSTIRHVSAEPRFPPPPAPTTGSKKRKFEFENDKVVDGKDHGNVSDKENFGEAENEEEGRPKKRVKASLPEPPAPKPATRFPTLGVRPTKTDKAASNSKPKTISRARLNALAQPKRRA